MPDLKSEFSDIPHDRGVLSAARSAIQIVLIVSFLFVSSQHHT